MKKKATLLFLSPWIVCFFVFWLYPFVFSFALSFMQYNPLSASETRWIGLSNYAALLQDTSFFTSLKNTFWFCIGTIPVTTTLAVILGVMINQRIPFKGVFRTGFFIPSIISIVVTSIIFKALYAPNGDLNRILSVLGVQGMSWLVDTRFALPAIMAMDVWASFGYYTVLVVSALQAVPGELYESAKIDGAGEWASFFHITMPQIRPMLLFIVVVNTIRSFQIFTEVFTLTRGGPLDSTLTIVYYLYEKAFHFFRMGSASSIAYVLFGVIMVCSIFQMKLFHFGRGVSD